MKNNKVCDGQSGATGGVNLCWERRRPLLLPRLAFSEASVSLEAPVPTNGLNHDQNLLIPADPSFGRGGDKVSVLGSGSEYLAVWLLGFTHGLNARDARPDHVRYDSEELLLDPVSER